MCCDHWWWLPSLLGSWWPPSACTALRNSFVPCIWRVWMGGFLRTLAGIIDGQPAPSRWFQDDTIGQFPILARFKTMTSSVPSARTNCSPSPKLWWPQTPPTGVLVVSLDTARLSIVRSHGECHSSWRSSLFLWMQPYTSNNNHLLVYGCVMIVAASGARQDKAPWRDLYNMIEFESGFLRGCSDRCKDCFADHGSTRVDLGSRCNCVRWFTNLMIFVSLGWGVWGGNNYRAM